MTGTFNEKEQGMAAGNETLEEKLVRALRSSGRINEAIGMALTRVRNADAKEKRILEQMLDDYLKRQEVLLREMVMFGQ